MPTSPKSPIAAHGVSPGGQSTGPSRVLLIRPSALGDVCRSVPVLASLKREWPGACIDWLVQDSFVGAVAHHPDLSRAIQFPRHRFGRQLKVGRTREIRRWILELRQTRYDVVIDAQGLFRSGLFASCTRAPRRIGYANAQEFAWLGYTEKHHIDRDRHAVDRMLGLVTAAGIEPVADMRLYAAEAEREWVGETIGGSYAVLAPTSRWIAKQWPADRFAEVARRLLDSHADRLDRVVLVGGPNESEQVPELVAFAGSEPRVLDLIGDTSIARLMALVEGASLVVANDSAALHMAVGFDRPIVALFGPTRTELVGPYGREADVVRGDPDTGAERFVSFDHKNPANRVAMERIDVETVSRACAERLAADLRS